MAVENVRFTAKPSWHHRTVSLLIRQHSSSRMEEPLLDSPVKNTDFGVVALEYESPQVWLIGTWF